MVGREQAELVHRGRFDSPFFRSKFRVPTPPRHLVHRTRLIELLDDLAAYPVTAVVAPAGAGKTALAADWLRHCGRPSAWLALDESDRDPAQFCVAVISAVESLVPGGVDRARTAVHGPGGPVGALRVMTDDLELTEGEEAVLVVDDLHHVDDSELTRSMLVTFVEHKPDWLHLLLLSRRRPALAIDRLRACGELADVGFDALRFSEAEDLEMLSGLCPDTAEQDLAKVAAWSGGWAAALQLAALAVRSKRPTRLAAGDDGPAGPVGSDRLVDSYLWREVLQAEREELVELLVSTAVVDRMNYGLAEALTGRCDAGDLLLEAEERGLFVSGFDSGGWFEVHSLVRDLLLAELRRRSPERLREQHARAARWLESMGDGTAAIEHWLDAGRPAVALRLLAGISMSGLDVAGADEIDRIMSRIPPEVWGADVTSLVQFAWCRLLLDREGFLDALAAVEGAVAEREPAGETAQLDILRSTAAWLTGDWQGCVDHALAGLEHRADATPADPAGRFGWSLVTHGVALDERWGGGDGIVGGRAAVAPDAYTGLPHEAARAVGLALAGHPLDSLRVAAGVRRLAEHTHMRTLRTELQVAEAIVARELGDSESAELALEDLAARTAYPCTYVRGLALLELVEMRLDAGDVGTARSLFGEVEEVVERELDGPGARGWLARAGVLVALRQEDLAAAEHWSRLTHDSFWRPAGEARIHLAAGRHPDAAEAIGRAQPRCVRHQVVRGLLLARAISDVDHEAAAKSVELAVDRAAERGMLQTVAVNGAPVLELVELAAWRVPSAWMDRLRRALTPELARGVPAPGLVEELTSRERDVMRLLPSRLTLREIASELFVSQNTLKFHLRVIYRKLGVNSRAEAVETARALRLLGRG
jgi:LuxR family maltose regulon positive regulatory protein